MVAFSNETWFQHHSQLFPNEIATDDQLKSSSDWNSDQTIKSYATAVIQPYLEIPPDIEANGPDWQAYVHVSSSNIRQFARSVIYQRRKAMKSAVELAMYEIKTLDGVNNGGNKQGGLFQGDPTTESALRARIDALNHAAMKKDAAIRALEAERGVSAATAAGSAAALAATTEGHPREALLSRIARLEAASAAAARRHEAQVRDLRAKHEAEIKAKEERFADLAAKRTNEHRLSLKRQQEAYGELLTKRNEEHRREARALKDQLEGVEERQRVFLESYVEASLDALGRVRDGEEL